MEDEEGLKPYKKDLEYLDDHFAVSCGTGGIAVRYWVRGCVYLLCLPVAFPVVFTCCVCTVDDNSDFEGEAV